MVRLRIGRETAGTHIAAIRLDSARNFAGKIRILARKFRRVADGESNEIVEDENLAIAVWAGADADGWNAELFGDARGEFARNGFEHHGECAGGFNSFCIALKLFRGVCSFSLDVKPAQSIDGLWREANVAHHGYLRFDEPGDQ